MRIVAMFLIAALTACASLNVTPVQPYGKDTFTVSASSRSPVRARAAVIDAANAHCAQQLKTMVPVSEQPGGRTTKTLVLVFACQ